MLFVNNKQVEVMKFPDGTQKIVCDNLVKYFAKIDSCYNVYITWLYDNDSELFTLQCVVDHLHEIGRDNIILRMPYVPNARMDRTKDDNEFFTLKTFCNVINAMKFKKVYVLDIHSYVGAALLDNVKTYNLFEWVCEGIHCNAIKLEGDYVIFFPDEGAMKRYSEAAANASLPFVFGMKNRDWDTGKIKGLSVIGDADLHGKNVLIVDDICSKGGTFYYGAKALKARGVDSINLFVPHLENSVYDGKMINSGLINNIFTTDSIYRKNEAPIHTDGMANIEVLVSYEEELKKGFYYGLT